ncbi:MAG: hypothetical protein J6Q71_07300, partial [Bacteroidales bacterium]|nr:hypothetical protein [Bacteroidales bacterium]
SPRPAEHNWPRKTFFGSYIASGRDSDFVRVEGGSHNPVVFNTEASIVGYKYFNFDACHGDKSLRLNLELVPLGQNGHIDIFIGNPQKNGLKVDRINISDKLPQNQLVCLSARVPKIARINGKQALFLVFHLDTDSRTPANTSVHTSSNAPSSTELSSPALAPEKSPSPAPSLCELHYINFE